MDISDFHYILFDKRFVCWIDWPMMWIGLTNFLSIILALGVLFYLWATSICLRLLSPQKQQLLFVMFVCKRSGFILSWCWTAQDNKKLERRVYLFVQCFCLFPFCFLAFFSFFFLFRCTILLIHTVQIVQTFSNVCCAAAAMSSGGRRKLIKYIYWCTSMVSMMVAVIGLVIIQFYSLNSMI